MNTINYKSISLLLLCLITACAQINTKQFSSNTSKKPYIITEEQFEILFPNRIPFYSYAGLIEATKAYPAFGNNGNEQLDKQEVAAFLSNIRHESDQLRAVTEYDTRNHDKYCNDKEGVRCAPGKQYFGRGPIQLSWNFNYALAGKALGLDLLNDPDMVSRVPAVAWKTALWYWMEIKGPAPIPAHQAMRQSLGFGETVRSINGYLECGKTPDNIGYKQQQERIEHYLAITKLIGVAPGNYSPCE